NIVMSWLFCCFGIRGSPEAVPSTFDFSASTISIRRSPDSQPFLNPSKKPRSRTRKTFISSCSGQENSVDEIDYFSCNSMAVDSTSDKYSYFSCRSSIKDNEWDQNPFLSLPNELLAEIMYCLSVKDRVSFGAVNDRIGEIERKAGRRIFTNVHFFVFSMGRIKATSVSNNMISEMFLDLTAVETTLEFFKHATTEKLDIQGCLNNEDDKNQRSVFETINFQKLQMSISEEDSGRLIDHLIRGRRFIEEVVIRWWNAPEEIEVARRVIMEFPPMNNCKLLLPVS
ncbi:hypothetical protein PENTCL1PPCAC_5715, partial [Pristionchus entomophagus]